MNPVSFADRSVSDPVEIKTSTGTAWVWTVSAIRPQEVQLPEVRAFVCWRRFLSTWTAPEFGRSLAELPPLPQVQLLVCQLENGDSLALLPLVSRAARWVFRGDQGRVVLEPTWNAVMENAASVPLLAAASAANPFDAIAICLDAARSVAGVGPLHPSQRGEELLGRLGLCTWDAFYQEVSAAKVGELLDSVASQGFRPGWIILDDGWQDSRDDRLCSFRAHPVKFSDGLAETISNLKSRHGLESIGVWLAIGGHWKGVDSHGELAGRYPLERFECGDPNDPASVIEERWHVRPEAAEKFYGDWFCELAAAGVDFVKIDNQGNFPFAVAGSGEPLRWVEAHQKAIDRAVRAHFHKPSLFCMSHGSEVIWQYRAHGWWRSSRDYFPKRPHSHGRHLVMNAWNSALMRHFALPDWDMFQSGGACGGFHAAARALSGGPVYLSDSIETLDAGVVRPALAWDASVLGCSGTVGLPPSRFYIDCESERRLLVLKNALPCGGQVLGFFHCRWRAEASEGIPIYDEIASREIAEGEGWMLHRVGTDECVQLPARIGAQLEFGHYAFFQLLRPSCGVTALGLHGAYIPAATILEDVSSGGQPTWRVRGGGTFLFHSPVDPQAIRFERDTLPWRRRGEIFEVDLPHANGLLEWVSTPAARVCSGCL
jgi:raffinose synthase